MPNIAYIDHHCEECVFIMLQLNKAHLIDATEIGRHCFL